MLFSVVMVWVNGLPVVDGWYKYPTPPSIHEAHGWESARLPRALIVNQQRVPPNALQGPLWMKNR